MKILLIAALVCLSATKSFAASPTKSTAVIQIFATEAQGKAGSPLPEKLIELSLPFYSPKGCESKVFFPKSTLSRLDIAEDAQLPVFDVDSDALIADAQTTVQKMFKKLPDIKELQRVARDRISKQTMTPEWSQDSTRKIDQTKWDTIDMSSATRAVLVMDGKTSDTQAKGKFVEALKEKVTKRNISIDAPMDIESARTIMAKALCEDSKSENSIIVYFVSKLPKPSAPPPLAVSPTKPKTKQPTKEKLNCHKVPLMDKEVCTRDKPSK